MVLGVHGIHAAFIAGGRGNTLCPARECECPPACEYLHLPVLHAVCVRVCA
jgi:hypothetical protein